MIEPMPVRRRPLTTLGFAGALWIGLAAAGCNAFGRGAQRNDKEPAAGTTQPERKPCDDFAARICSKTVNALSPTCVAMKSTVELFTDATCTLALEQIDHSLKALGQRNMSCDELQARLCADMDPTTKSCETVKKSTARFPAERCKEMLGRYPDVLADLKQALKIK